MTSLNHITYLSQSITYKVTKRIYIVREKNYKKSEERRQKWRREVNTHGIFKVPSLADLVLIFLVHFVPPKRHFFPDLVLQFVLKAGSRITQKKQTKSYPSSTDIVSYRVQALRCGGLFLPWRRLLLLLL